MADEIQEASEGQEKVGYWGALKNPKYRLATYMSIVLTMSMQGTGINAINIFSSNIYTDI